MFFTWFFALLYILPSDPVYGTTVFSRLLGQRDELCIDRPLYEECLASCRVSYLDCLSSCDSSLCHSNCLSSFSACDNSCPCGGDCQTGCVECGEHPLCLGQCEDAEQNNAEYKSCLNDSLDELTSCMKICEPTGLCHETCCSGHLERMASCPCFQSQGSGTSTVSPTTQHPSDPNGMFILVVRYSITDSYVISGDGSSQVSAKISAPADNYAKNAQHAVIENQFFIFGGDSDKKKIAVLDGCQFVESSVRLLNDIDYSSAALPIENDSRALICFSDGTDKRHCEIFDGSSSSPASSTICGHKSGKLGIYKNQPTTVGSHGFGDLRKVETLTQSGWSVIGDPPISDIRAHVLVGLEGGNLLLLGGIANGSTVLNHIWLLSEDSWSRSGSLKSAVSQHSSLKINDSIFLVAGYNYGNPLQRLEVEGDQIKSSEIIGSHSTGESGPVLFQVSSGYCA